MKRIAYISAFVLALSACTVEPFNEENGTKVTIEASIAENNLTKTIIQEGTGVYWEQGDEIKLFFDGIGSRLSSTISEPAAVSSFSGTFNGILGFNEGFSNSTPLWGLFPYRADATADNESVTTTLPSEQTGRAGSFAKGTFITLAKSQSLKMGFYNVCGGVRFSLVNDNIKEVVFEGMNGENLAGKVKLIFDDGYPVVSKVESGENAITLTAPGGGCFEKEKWYYIVALPGTLSGGFKMTFNTADKYAVRSSSKPVTIKRGVFGSLEDVDQGLVFIEKGSAPIEYNLSERGTANCYIVSEAGTYKFEVVQGNSYTSAGDVKGVKVLWESFGTDEATSVGDLIKPEVSYDDNYIFFSTNDTFRCGNAVIAAYSDENCTEGNVLWSWHIWLTEQPELVVHSNNAGILMDRNLGATSAESSDGPKTYGLLYQWGRKDPFVGSSTSPASSTFAKTTIVWPKVVCPDREAWNNEFDFVLNSGSIEYATKHPTTLIYRYSQNDWEDQESIRKWDASAKTKYDPCPPGYRVPSISVWNNAGFPDHSIICEGESEYGITIGIPYCSPNSWYPGTGAYLFSYNIGHFGDSYLWSSDAIIEGNREFGKSYYTNRYSSRTYGYWGTYELYSALSVRCCKDESFSSSKE